MNCQTSFKTRPCFITMQVYKTPYGGHKNSQVVEHSSKPALAACSKFCKGWLGSLLWKIDSSKIFTCQILGYRSQFYLSDLATRGQRILGCFKLALSTQKPDSEVSSSETRSYYIHEKKTWVDVTGLECITHQIQLGTFWCESDCSTKSHIVSRLTVPLLCMNTPTV